ncbi:MAG: hypothetical protein EPO26_03965 [Chloroflexota bacterium]|nr:MAG: hypothetical protein EPO26_03965 [Chloroflexota bacterium]
MTDSTILLGTAIEAGHATAVAIECRRGAWRVSASARAIASDRRGHPSVSDGIRHAVGLVEETLQSDLIARAPRQDVQFPGGPRISLTTDFGPRIWLLAFDRRRDIVAAHDRFAEIDCTIALAELVPSRRARAVADEIVDRVAREPSLAPDVIVVVGCRSDRALTAFFDSLRPLWSEDRRPRLVFMGRLPRLALSGWTSTAISDGVKDIASDTSARSRGLPIERWLGTTAVSAAASRLRAATLLAAERRETVIVIDADRAGWLGCVSVDRQGRARPPIARRGRGAWLSSLPESIPVGDRECDDAAARARVTLRNLWGALPRKLASTGRSTIVVVGNVLPALPAATLTGVVNAAIEHRGLVTIFADDAHAFGAIGAVAAEDEGIARAALCDDVLRPIASVARRPSRRSADADCVLTMRPTSVSRSGSATAEVRVRVSPGQIRSFPIAQDRDISIRRRPWHDPFGWRAAIVTRVPRSELGLIIDTRPRDAIRDLGFVQKRDSWVAPHQSHGPRPMRHLGGDTIALRRRSSIPSSFRPTAHSGMTVDIGDRLASPPDDGFPVDVSPLGDSEVADAHLVARGGERVVRGQTIARKSSFFGLRKTVVRSPATGRLEIAPDRAGVRIVPDWQCSDATAHVSGVVVGTDDDGPVLASEAVLFDGAIARGPSCHGRFVADHTGTAHRSTLEGAIVAVRHLDALVLGNVARRGAVGVVARSVDADLAAPLAGRDGTRAILALIANPNDTLPDSVWEAILAHDGAMAAILIDGHDGAGMLAIEQRGAGRAMPGPSSLDVGHRVVAHADGRTSYGSVAATSVAPRSFDQSLAPAVEIRADDGDTFWVPEGLVERVA